MGLMQNYFPVFEANQVLTSGHLNDVFNYLDEQERLTRSNLIGIGIVCGLKIALDGATIHLSEGCGVTSQGYLIVEPKDVALVSYRANYTIPNDPDYPPFKDAATKKQYPLWELFPAGEPNTTALNSPANFLDDKAVVLFLELKQQGLRNCSPNNCDDKGSQVTAVVKRLLIRKPDLDQIIAAAKALGGGLTAGELEAALLEKLNLPDLRVLRFDVLNSSPVTSNDVYAAFLRVFGSGKMAQATGAALNAAYDAFKPVLQDAYRTNPFIKFDATYGFLDSAPTTPAQVRFLQYYVDLFDDLLRAYDEFRWSGIELICACCPPEGLFPRHLMLGLLHPENASEPEIYRQGFLPSAAVGDCIEQTKELLQLFQRLVEIAACFTNAPTLPAPNPFARMDPQIRITPSVIGCKPLADRAIPYYYRENGAPPLYRLWSVEKTRRSRANRNLGYRFDEYSPLAPAFVSSPLSYDLEPYNFLRVEGHLGKNFVPVLQTLLLMRSEYRLPVEFIALRTGAYDDTQPVDLSEQKACFQDLQAVYEALREELLSSLTEATRYLYDVPVAGLNLIGGTPTLSLLKEYASKYRHPDNSVGAWYEKYLTSSGSGPYIVVNSDQIDADAVRTVSRTLFNDTTGLAAENSQHAILLYYFSKLAESMPVSLDALVYAEFERRYQDTLALVRYFRSETIKNISTDLKTFAPQEELIELFDELLFSCKLDAIKAVYDEYLKRIRELKKRQFLSEFLLHHPGIQHKAGVPVGGTFILVYHGEPAPPAGGADVIKEKAVEIAKGLAARPAMTGMEAPAAATEAPASAKSADAVNVGSPKTISLMASSQGLALADAIGRIASNEAFALNPDINLLLGSLTGKIPISDMGRPVLGIGEAAAKIIGETVNELKDGDIIADFYLPYLVSCDCCNAVEFVLPMPPPTFGIEVGCTDANGTASVTIKAKGGVPPYDVNIDKAGYQPLGPALSWSTGTRTVVVRDAEGIESDTQSVTVAPPITFSTPDLVCVPPDFKTYTATFKINGGTPPFAVNGKAIPGVDYTSEPVPSGQQVSFEVVDSKQCKASIQVVHTCVPPPTFAIEVGCTDANGAASATIKVKGGVPPYDVNIDKAGYKPLGPALSLSAGMHSVVVRDSEGIESGTQSVTVAPPIKLGEPTFNCTDDFTTYTVKFHIDGGTPPFTVNGKATPGVDYTSESVPSGQQVSFEVVDSKQCKASMQLTHTCVCDLPCNGMAVRRGYRFWLPEPAPNAPYTKVQFDKTAISFQEVEGGPMVPLPEDEVKAIFNNVNVTALTSQFVNTVNVWIDRINKLIAAQTKKPSWLTLSYVSGPAGGLGTLWIEHFDCLSFEIAFDSSFQRPDIVERLSLAYARENTTVLNEVRAINVKIPAFDGTKIDKCHPQTPVVNLCPKTDFTANITSKATAPMQVQLDVNPADPSLTYLWEIQDAKPQMAMAPSVQVTFSSPGNKAITVTAFNKDGCSTSKTTNITVSNLG